MTSRLTAAAPMALAAATLAFTAAGAAPVQKPTPNKDCFASNNWRGWSAPGDGDVLYLSVGLKDIYRVELTKGSRVRKSGDTFLVNQIRGSNWICSPLDLQLTLSDHNGFRQPIIARSLRKLTPEEAAALPRKDRPS